MNDQNFAREIEEALDKDLPKLKPHAVQGREDPMAVFMRAGDHLLREKREKLAQLEFEHLQKQRNLALEHDRATAALRAEIATLAQRMGFVP